MLFISIYLLSLQPNMEYCVSMKKTVLMAIANALIIITILSCGVEQASTPEQLLSRAKSMAEADPQGALLVIDSLHEMYPKEIRSRREADTLEWQIEYNEAIKNLPVLDSMMTIDSIRLAELSKNFRYSKIDEYQDYGSYEHKRFQTENNAGRCYLKPTINEIGEIIIISYYSGKKEEHNGFTVRVGEYEKSVVETENISGFMDGSTYREFITISDSIDNGITGFIATSEESVRVRLNGEKEHEYEMGMNDVNAFKETVELAKLLQEMNLYNIQIRKFTKMMNLLEERLQ